MKTIEEMKVAELAYQNQIIRTTQDRLNSLNVNSGGTHEISTCERVIENATLNIEYIDEFTSMKIGKLTNAIISAIQEQYGYHRFEYLENFEAFISKYILFGGSIYDSLGVSLENLLCFKGKDPNSPEICDLFRQLMNIQFGTSIPMSGVVEQAHQEYNAACNSGNKEAEQEAYIHLRETQRDAGELSQVLACDKHYQKCIKYIHNIK